MWKFIVAIALVSVVADATLVKYTDCGSKYGVIHMIDLTPCKKDPCQLPLNSNVNLTVQFQSKVATKAVYVDMNAAISGFPEPVPLPDYMGCDQGIKCPVKAADKATFMTSLYLEPDFPTLGAVVTLELQDDNMDDIVCATFNITLVDGLLSVPSPRQPSQGNVLEEEVVVDEEVIVETKHIIRETDTVLRFRPRP